MLKDGDKTKEQLINEMAELRQRITELEKSEEQRRLAKDALRESEKRFRELVDLLPQTVFEIDEKGNLTFVNAYGFESYGYTQEDFDKGLNALQMFIPEDRDRVKENIRRIMNGEKLGGNEYTALRKDSSTFPVIIYSSPIIRENKPVGLRGIVIDITGRKRAEEALRESEEKYRDLVEKINDIIYAADKNGVITYISPVVESVFGYSPSEIIGRLFTEFVYQEDLPISKERFQETLSANPETAEYRVLNKAGEIRWIRTSSKPTFMGNKVIGLKGVLTDITERKKAEEALRESEEKFRTLAEQSPNMIFINKKGKIVYANKKCEEIMGYKKDEFYSPNFDFLTLMVPESLEKIKLAFSKHMKGEEVEPYDYTLITKDGKRIEAILTTKLISYEGDRAILGIATDITERKKSEEALQRSELQYRTTIDSMGDPIHVVDKDLRIIIYNKVFKQWAEELGLETEVIGRTVFETFPFLPDKVRDGYLQVFNTGKTLITEEITKVGGKEHITETRKIPVFEGEKVVRVVTVVRDITDRKWAEEALKQRAEELERSKAELEQSLQELLERVERDYGELVTRPIPAIDVEERGATFLYPVDQEKEACALFLSRKASNRPALAITRTFPPRFHRKLGREVETVWLTSNRVPGMVCVDPSDTMNLLLVLSEFIKRAPEGVILFEGVEYIISIAGFERFLHIVQLLNDKIAMTEGTIYMILDLGVLEKKEAKHILRECLLPPNGVGDEEEAKGFGNEV